MADDNEDLMSEGVEITGSAHVEPDADDVDLAEEEAPIVDEEDLSDDDELDGKELDLPEYLDDDTSAI